MKDYKEVAREVFARREEYLIRQKKRRKIIASVASVCAVLCVVVGMSVGYGNTHPVSEPSSEPVKGGITSIMVNPTVNTGTPEAMVDIPNKGTPDYGSLSTGTPVGESAAVKRSDVVVYAEIASFEQVGTDILCTLSVIDMLKGEDADTVLFNISEEDREGFMALVKGERAVFLLSDSAHGLNLTHGSQSIFYEAGEDDYRSYDRSGLICYNLTMKELKSFAEAGL